MDLEQLAPLGRHVLGHHDLDRVALDAGDHRHGDAGVARRRLDDGAARRQGPVLFGFADHRPGDAVLHRPCRVLTLELGEDANLRIGAQIGDIDDRRVADEVEDGRVDSHNPD